MWSAIFAPERYTWAVFATGIAVVLASIVLQVLQFRRVRQKGTVRLSQSHETSTFFSRNADNLVLAALSALAGGIVTLAFGAIAVALGWRA